MPNPIKYDRGFRVNFNYEGRKIRKKFPAHRHPDPKKSANNYINSIMSGVIPDDALLQDQINEYLHWAEATGQKRPSTIKSDRLRLNLFSEFTDAKSARRITIQHLRAFQIYFLENHPFYRIKKKTEREGISLQLGIDTKQLYPLSLTGAKITTS